jgi:adenosylmethionine-8-amino-7-oxononanoate aminotransferase
VPLGGVIVAPSVHEPLGADPDYVFRHGYTYSGHGSACAAGLVCLDITEREGLVERASHLGDRLGPALRAIRDEGLIADVRGVGGIWGVGVHEGENLVGVRDRMLAAGVIVRPIAPTTLAICPPLVIEDADLDLIPATLRAALT